MKDAGLVGRGECVVVFVDGGTVSVLCKTAKNIPHITMTLFYPLSQLETLTLVRLVPQVERMKQCVIGEKGLLGMGEGGQFVGDLNAGWKERGVWRHFSQDNRFIDR